MGLTPLDVLLLHAFDSCPGSCFGPCCVQSCCMCSIHCAGMAAMLAKHMGGHLLGSYAAALRAKVYSKPGDGLAGSAWTHVKKQAYGCCELLRGCCMHQTS